MKYFALVCSGMLITVFSAFSSPDILLDRFAARVNDDVITESMVEMELALLDSPLAPERIEKTTWNKKNILERLIDRHLIVLEAHRFITIPDQSIGERVDKYIQKSGGREVFLHQLNTLGTSEQEFRHRIRSLMLFEAYIDQRIRVFIQIQPRDIDIYIQQHAAELGLDPDKGPQDGQISTSMRELIGNLLRESLVNERLEELLRNLRKTADIKILEAF